MFGGCRDGIGFQFLIGMMALVNEDLPTPIARQHTDLIF